MLIELLRGCEAIRVRNQDEFFFSSWQSQIVMQVVFGYTYIVANGSSCCFFKLDSRLVLSSWKASCGKVRDCFTRYTNPQLIVKCEQIYARQVVSDMTEQQSQNLCWLKQTRSLLFGTIEYIVAAFKAAIENIWVFVFFCNARRWSAWVQRKFESVFLIKKNRNNLLFSYYELGFRCFELKDVRAQNFPRTDFFKTLTAGRKC